MNLVIIFFIVVVFLFFLVEKFKKDKKLDRAWWNFGDHKWFVSVILLLLLAVVLLNNIPVDPTFNSSEEQINYGIKTRQPWLVSAGYKESIRADSNNLDKNYNFIKYNFDRNQYQRPHYHDYDKEKVYIFQHYSHLAESDDSKQNDIGNLCLTVYYVLNKDPFNAKDKIEQVKDIKLRYYNNYLGDIKYYYNDLEGAIEAYKTEIALNGDKEDAFDNLARAYYFNNKYNDLVKLVYTDDGKKFVPYELKQRVYFNNSDWTNYFLTQFNYFFEGLTPIVFLAALLVLFTWIFYLRLIDRASPEAWLSICITIVLSSLFVVPVLFLYGFFEYKLDFHINGETGNDLMYCIFGIGVLEEMVKIIPFLLILQFTRWIKEPIDYIVYASLTALGFAFVENLLYIDHYGIDVVHTRAFTAAISHMIDTSIIAYGLILAKYRYKKNSVLFFIPFFLIAACSHGFYDFWLTNNDVSEFSFITFLYLLTSILFYSSFINNALNNSESVKQDIKMNTKRLSGNLAASLSFIIVFEFICLCFVYGTTIANRELSSSVVSGGYMILFLSVRLSNIDIVPDEWAPLQFFTGLLPLSFAYDTKLNYNSVVGLTLKFTPARKMGILYKLLPAEGEVLKREKISGFSGWFLVKMQTPLVINGKNYPHAFIRAKDKDELIENNSGIMLSFNVPVDETVLSKPDKKKGDLLFVDWAVVN